MKANITFRLRIIVSGILAAFLAAMISNFIIITVLHLPIALYYVGTFVIYWYIVYYSPVRLKRF